MRMAAPVLVGLLIVAGGCTTDAQAPKQPSAGDVVATLGSTSIRLEEVDERALAQSTDDFGGVRLSQALYQARRLAIDTIIRNTLLDQEAQARGIDRQALVEREITTKVIAPTEADVRVWYDTHPERVQGAPLEQVRAPITAVLTQERTMAVQDTFMDGLKARTVVKILLEPPREKVEAAGRPARGAAAAPIEIIEFSDFQCPYCERAYPVVKRLLSTYGDRIRVVYRHFPLPNHPNARPAAEASACAAEQGKFWEYHDRLFENQGQLADTDLKEHASKVGLDAGKFGACFDMRKYQADIDADMAAARDAGITGTPGFFINGRLLEGSQPFENFKTIIDEELLAR